tara:strand:- start:671 stop:1168 length:498 start_codon:yes stop_codon:yes gene_type:complete
MAKLLILAASTGKNLELAMDLQSAAEVHGHDVDVMDLCALDLPIYTPESEKQYQNLEAINSSMERILSSDGMIVCAPEYNGSTPPVLNNFIAWVSVQSTNFRLLFNKRDVGLASVSGGGGHQVILSMRMQFSYLGSNVLGRSIVVNKGKLLNPEAVEEMIGGVLK